MRTTVTLESAAVNRLLRETGLKSKGFRPPPTRCGKPTFDRRIARWRHLSR